jgi:hypothetical protein
MGVPPLAPGLPAPALLPPSALWGVWAPVVPSLATKPRVPKGGTQTLLGVGAGAGGVAPPDLGATAAPPSVGAPPAGATDVMPVVGCGTSRQVHAVGQSVVALQLVILGVHDPGKLIVVVHMPPGGTGAVGSVGAGAAPLAFEPPDDPEELTPVAVPLPLPPLAQPETLGAHVNPSPQSTSALHGNSHL